MLCIHYPTINHILLKLNSQERTDQVCQRNAPHSKRDVDRRSWNVYILDPTIQDVFFEAYVIVVEVDLKRTNKCSKSDLRIQRLYKVKQEGPWMEAKRRLRELIQHPIPQAI